MTEYALLEQVLGSSAGEILDRGIRAIREKF